ncbi:condensation domain-containing protein [Streptosporangium sp. NPDC051023]|uniref:condensation domain-containing protein n=1 Tax=Streptosporangium sp. NPDC051023 TaxID=3155410 RepID=UPI003450238C
MEHPPAVIRRTVAFRGGRTVSAPLTWGQRQVWNDIQWMLPDTAFFDIALAVPMPAGADLARITAQIGELVSRHESLRTLFFADPRGRPAQRVLAAGQVRVDVLPDGGDVPDAVFDHFLTGWSSQGFDTAREIPARFLVRHVEGGVSTVVVCTSHLAADHASQRLLVAELYDLVAAAMTGTAAPARRPAREPADQAEFEASPTGERLCERAIEHRRRQLTAAPPSMFPRRGTEAGQTPRFWRGERISRAVPLALRVLASRYRSGPSSVLLAAVAALLGVSTGLDRCALRLVVDNRETPESRFVIGTPTQEVFTTLPVGQDSFDSLVRDCWTVSTAAHRYGRCDPKRVDEVVDEVAKARGVDLDLSCFFNDTWSAFQTAASPEDGTAPDADVVLAALADSRFHWAERYDRDNISFFFTTFDTAESAELIKLSLLVDTRTIPPAAAEEFLRRTEALLVDLATGSGTEVRPSALPPVTGFPADRWRGETPAEIAGHPA